MKTRELIMAMMGVSALALAIPAQASAADNERGHWSRSGGQERSGNSARGGRSDRGNAIRMRTEARPERAAPQARVQREARPARVERQEQQRTIAPAAQEHNRAVFGRDRNDTSFRDIQRTYRQRAEQAQRDERRDHNRGDWRGRDNDRNRDHEWDRNDRNDRRKWSDRDRTEWRRDQDRDNRNWDRKRYSWDRDWRRDQRYNWQRYRNQYRNIYHAPRYYAPSGWGYGYRPFSVGITLWSGLYGSSYWIDDPSYYRLPPAYGSLRWIRYYDDALLVDIDTGYVVDVIRDFFW